MRFECESCASPEARGPSAETVRAVEGVVDWYVAVEDEPVGPLAAPAVRARWEAGQIGPGSLCWRPGLADWQPIAELRELHDYLRASSRPAPVAPRASARAEPPASAGSGAAPGLDALAGAELAGRAGAASRPGLLDFLTVAHGPPRPVNTAVSPQPSQGASAAAASPAPARRPSRLPAVGAFALGAAAAGVVAFALLARPQRPATDAPVAAAPPPAARPAATAAVPAPSEPGSAVRPPEARAEAAVAHAEVTPSPAPVRASNPPAATNPPAASEPRTVAKGASRRAEPSASRASHAASKPAAKPAAKVTPAAPAKAGPKVAMAEPQRARPQAAASREPELPPAPAAGADQAAKPAPGKTVPRDPLLDAVTDDELERELSGGAAKPPAKPSSAVYVPPARPGSDLPENVTPAQINEAVGARVSALKGCIEEQRAGDPGARGTLKLRWVIAGDGSVRDVRTVSSEYEGQPIARCIGGVVKGIRFPQSRTQGQEVVFPFKF